MSVTTVGATETEDIWRLVESVVSSVTVSSCLPPACRRPSSSLALVPRAAACRWTGCGTSPWSSSSSQRYGVAWRLEYPAVLRAPGAVLRGRCLIFCCSGQLSRVAAPQWADGATYWDGLKGLALHSYLQGAYHPSRFPKHSAKHCLLPWFSEWSRGLYGRVSDKG